MNDQRRPHPVIRYGSAVVGLLVATGFRLVISSWMGSGLPPFITDYPMIMVVAILAGLGPGIFATILSVLTSAYWLLPPAGQLAIASPIDRLVLVMFATMGIFISVIAARLRRTRNQKVASELKEAEEALHEMTQRLTYHIDNSPLAVIEWGPDMRLKRWSGAAERIFGWTAEEVLGKTMHDFPWIFQEDEGHVAEVSNDLLTGKDLQRFSTNRNYRKDGTVVHCEWYNSSRLDASGRIRSILSLVLDVTDRKRMEAEREKFASLADQSPEFIGICDMQGMPFYVNNAGMRLVGLDTLKQTIHTPVKDFFFPEDQRMITEEFFPRVLREGRAEAEIRFRHFKTGGAIWMIYNVFIIRDAEGKQAGLATVSRNITERKRAEEALRQTAQELARSNQDLEQFAYVCSHDLKEPLRMVTGFAGLLRERYQGRLDAKADEYIGFAAEAALRMQGLVDDLLTYSRVGRSTITATINTGSALDRALKSLHASIHEADAKISRDPLPSVLAHELEMSQLFQNLVGNAIKFRSPDRPCRIHVSARLLEKEDPSSGTIAPEPMPNTQQAGAARWVFSVRDNGIGIDPQFADRIFMIFQRLHTREEYPGTGVGLAICKKIVEQHGGRIWVESEPGKGSTFSFSMPAEPSQTGDIRQEAERTLP